MEFTAEQRRLLRTALQVLLDARRHSFSVAFALVNSAADNAENIITPELFGISQLQLMLTMLEESCGNSQTN